MKMMIRKAVFLFAVLPVFISCGEKNEPVVTDQPLTKDSAANNLPLVIDLPAQQPGGSFDEFVSNLPVMEKGFKLNCNLPGGNLTYINHHSDFLDESAQVMGRMQSYQNYHFIICAYPADINLPVLEIYTSDAEMQMDFVLYEYGFCTDLRSNHQFSSFEILDEYSIATDSYIDSAGVVTITKQDTIDLVEVVDGILDGKW